MRIVALVALVALALVAGAAACGGKSDADSPATLDASALPGLESRSRTLDTGTLAQDSFGPTELAELLEDAGYVSGSEREFYGRTDTFDHVVARALRFASAEGAEAYLGWLAGHADEILGRVEPGAPLPLGESGLLFSLVPCGTCKKELATFLAAWRRGETVLSLLAAGPGASTDSLEQLGRELDRVTG